MKRQAFILLIPLAVFLTETASYLPCWEDICTSVGIPAGSCSSKASACTAKKEKAACGADAKQDPCSASTEKTTCSKAAVPDQCSRKKDCGKKSPRNDCDNDTDCSTCPVCYLFILQSPFEWNDRPVSIERKYNLLDTRFISSYSNNVWKPPNGSTLLV